MAETVWAAPDARRLYADVKRIRAEMSTRDSLLDRVTLFTDLLGNVEDWKSESMNAETYFHAKALLYSALLSFAPDQGSRGAVINAYSALVDQEENRVPVAIWVWWARDLLSHAKKTGQVLSTKNSTIRSYQTLAEILGSGP